MGDNKVNTALNLLIALLTVGGPLAFFTTWKSTGSLRSALIIFFVYLLIVGVSGLVSRVWLRLQDKWSIEIAKKLNQSLKILITKNRYEYCQYQYQEHRYLDIRGIGGNEMPRALNLDQVYVATALLEYYRNQAPSTIPLGRLLDGKVDKKTAEKFVIIGRPGSGKTTLLRYITLMLAENQMRWLRDGSMPAKIPVFIKVGKFASFVLSHPRPNIPDALYRFYKSIGQNDVNISPNWLKQQLKNGKCVILVDGLDEIADPKTRQNMVDWVQTQMNLYPRNNYIITSRPHGYLSNPLLGVTVLEIDHFNKGQIEEFVNNWYLANEYRRTNIMDEGIRRKARDGARKLLRALAAKKELSLLAENPLLLTMIANVYSIKENLPSRRVELYADILHVSLERRYRKDDNDLVDTEFLSTSQKMELLEILAFDMMDKNALDVEEIVIYDLIKRALYDVDPNFDVKSFLKSIREQSDLLIEAEAGQYRFTHKTIQEYLASLYVVKNRNLEEALLQKIGQEWWSETIRLYSAQENATLVIEKCLEKKPLTSDVLSLAIDLLAEGKWVKQNIKDQLESVLSGLTYSEENRKLIARARLSSRIKLHMGVRGGVDNYLLTNLEYQLFIDEMLRLGKAFIPDHWLLSTFPLDHPDDPVLGVRGDDAVEFCNWLTSWDLDPTIYRVPNIDEGGDLDARQNDFVYWVKNKDQALVLNNLSKSRVFFDAKKIYEMFLADLDILRRMLAVAKKKSQSRNVTTEELLARSKTFPGSGSGYQDRNRMVAADAILRKRSEDLYHDSLFYEIVEQYIAQIGIDNSALLDWSEYFLEAKTGGRDFLRWLPSQQLLTTPAADLGRLSSDLFSFFENREVKGAFDQKDIRVINSLSQMANHFRVRTLHSIDYRDIVEKNWFYEYVRWYLRMSCFYVLAENHARMSDLSNYKIHQDVFDIVKKYLFGLLDLEDLIHGKRPASGIRVVKEIRLVANE